MSRVPEARVQFQAISRAQYFDCFSILKCGVLSFQEPFALFPGEELLKSTEATPKSGGPLAPLPHPGVFPLPSVPSQHAVRLCARYDFKEGDVTRLAGEMWQLEGPLTYHPQPEVVCNCDATPSRQLKFYLYFDLMFV